MIPGSSLYFTVDEYRDRWRRVHQAMADRGHDTLIVWQRGAGTLDRVGDVYWLTNLVMNGSGQDQASDEIGAHYTFCPVLRRNGRAAELHGGLPTGDREVS